jgi:hypothetical protein
MHLFDRRVAEFGRRFLSVRGVTMGESTTQVSAGEAKLAEWLFIDSPDGKVIFFPFSPLKGYVVPNRTFKRLIVKSYLKSRIGGWASVAVALTAGIIFKSTLVALLVIGLSMLLDAKFRIGRLTKKLAPLPVSLSLRSYAHWKNPDRLWDAFIRFAMMAGLLGLFPVMDAFALRRPDLGTVVLWLAFVFCAVSASLYGYLLRTRHQSQRPPATLHE